MPSESIGGNGSEGTSGASSEARGGSGGFSTGGWSSAKDSQIANDAMAKDLTDKFGVSPQAAQSAVGATNGLQGMVSKDGLSYSTTKALGELGYGNVVGANSNSTQTVDQVMASKNFNDYGMPAVIGAITSAVPGGALAMSALNAAQTDKYGSFFGGLVGGRLGVPMGQQIGALTGEYLQTGRAPTAGQVAGMVGGYAGARLGAQAGGAVAGGFGAGIGAAVGGKAGAIGGETLGNQTGGWSSGAPASPNAAPARPA